ncbi:MAG: hypothetical protein VX737_00970 [Pseudomonadota bacterium]|nr:hypothetical protein [Pseudomonadota bacterium]
MKKSTSEPTDNPFISDEPDSGSTEVELIRSPVPQDGSKASSECHAADDKVAKREKDSLFPTMPTDKFAYIRARGNGSCGPNSLAIIFCSYLLSGRYNQLYSNRHNQLYAFETKAVDLREFAVCWNLYYADNKKSHDDYIEIPSDEDPLRRNAELNRNILEKVKSKLDGYAEEYGGHSFKHCEALIAPVLRFAFNLNTELDNCNFGGYSPDYFLNLFPLEDVRQQADDEQQKEYIFAMEVSQKVKTAMSMGETIIRKHAFDLTNSDNSPNYGSFFNENGLDFASRILRISTIYALLSMNSENRRYTYSWPDLSARSGFNFNTEEINTWIDEQISLKAIVFNRSLCHFDACLPISVCEHHLVKPFYDDSLNPIEQQASYPNDRDVYNPANLPDSTRFPQRRTPSYVTSKTQDDTSFSYRFLNYTGYFAISVLAAISIFYAPMTSIISLLILIPSYLYRDKIINVFNKRQELTVPKLTSRPALSSWYKKIRLDSIPLPFKRMTCLKRTGVYKPRSA